jgi:hypothetical protein
MLMEICADYPEMSAGLAILSNLVMQDCTRLLFTTGVTSHPSIITAHMESMLAKRLALSRLRNKLHQSQAPIVETLCHYPSFPSLGSKSII